MTDQSSKRWEGLSITRELQMGVYYSGLRHKTFTLRVPVAGDSSRRRSCTLVRRFN